MSTNLLSGIPSEFAAFLKARGLVFTDLVQADLLASVLGAQFLLFAGPSGTGKSTAARALAEFFAGPDRWQEVGVRRQWATPQNFVGYYSPIANRFLPTEYLGRLATISGIDDHPPFLILEEANLSAPEGYLTPVINGLSHPITEILEWPLHAAGSDIQTPAGDDVPEGFTFGKFPRYLGSINVDATAHAPANKVSGRACVVLLDPPPVVDSATVIDALWSSGQGSTGAGSAAIGDPGDALNQARHSGTAGELASALDLAIAGLADALKGNPVTQRDQQRCLMYLAFFVELATSQPLKLDRADALAIGAEASILHFVLPGLVETDFSVALSFLEENARPDGVVGPRVLRLRRRDDQDAYGPPLDFWAATS